VEAADADAEDGFAMAGDVNLFILDPPEDDSNDTLDMAAVRCSAWQPRDARWQHAAAAAGAGQAPVLPRKAQAEVMVMVAEERFRRKGLARAAVQGIMRFALTSAELRQRLHVTSFVAKISSKNDASIKLFRSLGFVQTAEVAAFDELHFTWWPCAICESGATNVQTLLAKA